jgi:iron complex outermembrane recepter protein
MCLFGKKQVLILGNLPRTWTGLSLSLSHTAAEKWKGPGDLGPRKNANLMVRQPFPTRDEVNSGSTPMT